MSDKHDSTSLAKGPAGGAKTRLSMPEELFLSIIDATPLVSIDLILRSPEGRILLGKRVNRPAQGYWFVPGGRIRKNELVRDALQRIARAELGVSIDSPRLLGVYDHIYDDNYHGRPGYNTHYVVLGFAAELGEDAGLLPDDQHSELKWWELGPLLTHPDVHENTKRYFSPSA